MITQVQSGAYEQFVQLQDGTLKSLAADEMVTFRLNITTCDECEKVPEKVEISVKQPVLEGYRKGTLTIEQALAQLKVVEN